MSDFCVSDLPKNQEVKKWIHSFRQMFYSNKICLKLNIINS